MAEHPLLIGSGNAKKAAEMAALLKGLPWRVLSLRDFHAIDEAEETGETFEENAALKARYYGDAFGVACIADDSGLAVDALGGAPGVYSARYAGPGASDEANVAKLLDAMGAVRATDRTGRFVCVAAFYVPGGGVHLERGEVEGVIADHPRGANGFGYDPVFVPNGKFQTFAEMDPEDKHALSHRGRALAQLRAHLASLP